MDRRQIFHAALRAGAAVALPVRARGGARMRPRIAAVVTEYRVNSHADVIVTKFLEGCQTLDIDFRPQVDIVSLYLDQTPANDTGHEMAAKHKVPIFPTIEK